MSDHGYYHHPGISGDTVYFVSEDDLWSVPSAGGIARRLTSGLGASSFPAVSPDGRLLAFSSHEEGASEVAVMPAGGGNRHLFRDRSSVDLERGIVHGRRRQQHHLRSGERIGVGLDCAQPDGRRQRRRARDIRWAGPA